MELSGVGKERIGALQQVLIVDTKYTVKILEAWCLEYYEVVVFEIRNIWK